MYLDFIYRFVQRVTNTISLRSKTETAISTIQNAWPKIVALSRLTLNWLLWFLALVWRGSAFVLTGLIILIILIACVQIFVVTDRDTAYRYSAPQQPQCERANPDIKRALSGKIDNDELAAIKADKTGRIEAALTCMLQEHEIPVDVNARWRTGEKIADVQYRLAFLEFTQDGRPVELGPTGHPILKNQLEALLAFLNAHPADEHYIIAFIHGWRHDARIGDSNVAALRIYAAHVASFLDYRCKTTGRNCGAKVTGVYIGWRGARIDERSWLGSLFGTKIGSVLAAPTLFDRKPVSERVAPAVIASLKEIDKTIQKLSSNRQASELTRNKMITLGHSLGGNMLAVFLKEPMMALINRHRPGHLLRAPFGDLIVLINPASEAANWTEIQRTMRRRVIFDRTGEETNESEFIEQVIAGHRFFPRDQPPIYIAVTSAYSWPVGGIRDVDREGRVSDGARNKMREYRRQANYDWATHDVFPLFKGDLRPLAETLERNAEIYRDDVCADDLCKQRTSLARDCRYAWECFLRIAAAAARNFPFMNTNTEQTLTIGHFNPMRAPYGTIARREPAATVYGTTHELIVNQPPGPGQTETHYSNAAVPELSECAIVDHWLWQARRAVSNDSSWDSGYSYGGIDKPGTPPNLTPIRPRLSTEVGHLESQFVHGYNDGGMLPIVRGNDPFWNVRAFDTALKEHDGFVFYPFICAINQLVMDQVAAPD
jgi:hypothetical protein